MDRRPRKKTGANGQERALIAAVASIYDAALAPELWPKALSQLSRLVGSSWTIFSVIPLDPVGQGVTVQNPEADPEQIGRMLPYTLPENNPSIPHMLSMPAGRIILRTERFTDTEWERTGVYNDLYRPVSVYSSLGVPLIKSSRYFVPFGAMRARSRGDFDRSDLLALAHVVPHLQRAMQIMLRLNALERHAAAMEQTWNQLAFGVIVLDARGRILWSNRAGETALAGNNGLSGRAGSLFAAANGVNARLQRLIGEAAQTACGGGLGGGGAMLVPRRPPAQPLALVVAPLRAEGGLTGLNDANAPAVVVFVNDPDREPKTPQALLRELYRLTEREATLAALLMAGLDLRGACQEMQVSMHTVRTHLSGLFNKTNTRRQAQLVRLLVRHAAMLNVEGATSSRR